MRALLGVTAGVALVTFVVLGYYYVQFSRIIEARLHGERDRAIPRVFARPLTLRAGQTLTEAELVARLNDVGYTQRSRVERPGEFAVDGLSVALLPRGGRLAARAVRLEFAEPRPVRPASDPKAPPPRATRLQRVLVSAREVEEVTLDAPMLSGLITGARERRRRVALEAIPERMQQAVLAIEDRRFYGHPGIDPISLVNAVVTNLTTDRRVGRSTITQQLSRMFFLSEEFNAELQSGTRGRSWESYRRKALEIFMAVILETKATKDEILELYLNDIYLGNRGSFALHGVAEASRIFFGKDVSNLSVPEAALIAGVIQNPYQHSPFVNQERAKQRRDTVLSAMAEADYLTREAASRAQAEPIAVVARGVDNEAPYFVDYLADELQTHFPTITQRAAALDVYTTLDLNLQRSAQEAVRAGLARVDETLARRGKKMPAQAALVATNPRTGEVLAMVGGRFYNQSQFNRATSARRQPGSTFKPFVFLAAFEQAADERRSDLTPASMVLDEPSTWMTEGPSGEEEWAPRNYDNEYDGYISFRRALSHSRNLATIKVAETVGFSRVAALWRRSRLGQPLRGYPSIALGVFELTPMELATAYSLFANKGTIKPLHGIARVQSGDDELTPKVAAGPRLARPETTFLVTSMMRSVLNEGTGASARGAGFSLDAAGKTGTTNDLRDAWFVGFTPDLLAVVWVGFDDNTPLGLSGSQAALPIWTEFMKRALAGHGNSPFDVPSGISVVEIDRDTGMLALPTCPRVAGEHFLPGTEPAEFCTLHRW